MLRPFNVYIISEPLSSGLGLAASTHSLTNLPHLQFHFVFRRIQSLQLLLPTHPYLPLTLPAVLGRPFHGLSPLPFRFLTSAVSAFFRPPQFWILTTQPSVLPFRLFPALPHSGFSGARFRSRFLGFPLLSGLISHAFLPGSCTRLCC